MKYLGIKDHDICSSFPNSSVVKTVAPMTTIIIIDVILGRMIKSKYCKTLTIGTPELRAWSAFVELYLPILWGLKFFKVKSLKNKAAISVLKRVGEMELGVREGLLWHEQRADGREELVNSAEGRALQEERTAALTWQCSWRLCRTAQRLGALGHWGRVSDEGQW